MLVSVIIPALNEAEHIRRCIAAGRRHYTADEVEIIVADGGSSDGTPELVSPEATLVRSLRGRAVQMNRGAAAARGEIFVFCHADSQLPEGWREAVIAALSRPGVSGGAFRMRLAPAQGLIYLLNWIRFPADWRFFYGDQGQFTWKALFERVGGFPELPLLEDLELARALHRMGRLVRIPLPVISSSRRFLERGTLHQVSLNVRCVIHYLYLGATAEQLAQEYVSSRERAA